jgi:hypothetical protein
MMDDESFLSSQIHFDASSDCDGFKSNPFAKTGNIVRKCINCGQDVACHSSDVVSSTDIMKVLESVERVPSLILPNLYLGGFVAAMNIPFLVENNVKLVVNTARGLEAQFPKYRQAKENHYEGSGLECVCLEWVDSEEQELGMTELLGVVTRIHACLQRRQGVLMHCAQVSRLVGGTVMTTT